MAGRPSGGLAASPTTTTRRSAGAGPVPPGRGPGHILDDGENSIGVAEERAPVRRRRVVDGTGMPPASIVPMSASGIPAFAERDCDPFPTPQAQVAQRPRHPAGPRRRRPMSSRSTGRGPPVLGERPHQPAGGPWSRRPNTSTSDSVLKSGGHLEDRRGHVTLRLGLPGPQRGLVRSPRPPARYHSLDVEAGHDLLEEEVEGASCRSRGKPQVFVRSASVGSSYCCRAARSPS